MAHEFEIVSYGETNFKIFMVNMLYRTPHIHKDFELGLVLNGAINLITQGQVIPLWQGDFLLMNPFQSHELKADHPALVVGQVAGSQSGAGLGARSAVRQ